jgi:hypothetical protein
MTRDDNARKTVSLRTRMTSARPPPRSVQFVEDGFATAFCRKLGALCLSPGPPSGSSGYSSQSTVGVRSEGGAAANAGAAPNASAVVQTSARSAQNRRSDLRCLTKRSPDPSSAVGPFLEHLASRVNAQRATAPLKATIPPYLQAFSRGIL